jgi:hypothetical protein
VGAATWDAATWDAAKWERLSVYKAIKANVSFFVCFFKKKKKMGATASIIKQMPDFDSLVMPKHGVTLSFIEEFIDSCGGRQRRRFYITV